MGRGERLRVRRQVAPAEPPPPIPSPRSPPPHPPRRPPHLRHKGGAARRMVAAGAWAGARWKPQGSSRGGSGQGCRGG